MGEAPVPDDDKTGRDAMQERFQDLEEDAPDGDYGDNRGPDIDPDEFDRIGKKGS
jgi:hypothetical protein